jgi:type III secretion protein J
MRCPWIVGLVVLGCSAPIEQGLDETAANEIVTSLQRSGIEASKNREDDGAFSVAVPKGEVLAAMELLHTLGLPRSPRAGLHEVYKQPSLVPTPTEERARYVDALTGDVARTLETVDGVISARVHVVLPEIDPLAVDGKPRVPAQAAVLLKTRPGKPLPIGEKDVQRLVAGSVPGLEPPAVAVVITSAAELTSGPAGGLVSFGPLRLSPQSRRIVVAAVGVCSALLALLAGFVLMLSRRLAAAEREGSQ